MIIVLDFNWGILAVFDDVQTVELWTGQIVVDDGGLFWVDANITFVECSFEDTFFFVLDGKGKCSQKKHELLFDFEIRFANDFTRHYW